MLCFHQLVVARTNQLERTTFSFPLTETRHTHTYPLGTCTVPKGRPPNHVELLARGGTDLVHPRDPTGRPSRLSTVACQPRPRGITAASVVAAGGPRGKAKGYPTVTAVTEGESDRPSAARTAVGVSSHIGSAGSHRGEDQCRQLHSHWLLWV